MNMNEFTKAMEQMPPIPWQMDAHRHAAQLATQIRQVAEDRSTKTKERTLQKQHINKDTQQVCDDRRWALAQQHKMNTKQKTSLMKVAFHCWNIIKTKRKEACRRTHQGDKPGQDEFSKIAQRFSTVKPEHVLRQITIHWWRPDAVTSIRKLA